MKVGNIKFFGRFIFFSKNYGSDIKNLISKKPKNITKDYLHQKPDICHRLFSKQKVAKISWKIYKYWGSNILKRFHISERSDVIFFKPISKIPLFIINSLFKVDKNVQCVLKFSVKSK